MPTTRARSLIALASMLLPLGSATLAQQPASPATRRAAVLAVAPRAAVIVPSRGAFKTDLDSGFLEATDFYYLTGLSDQVGAVLLLDGPGRRAVLFLPPANPLITRPQVVAGPASAARLGVDLALPIDSLDAVLGRVLRTAAEAFVAPTDPRGAVRTPVPMADGVTRWRAHVRSLGFQGPVESANAVIRPLREIKDAGEIAILGRVGRLSGEAMLAGIRALRAGRSQRQVEVEVVRACVDGGGWPSFWPWAMSGPRAQYGDLFNSFVDYDGHDRKMQAGELVRVDVGCQLDHYMGDVGRTVPVSGRFDPGQREAWDLFIEGYRAGLPLIRDGAKVADIFAAATARIRTLGPTMGTPLGKEAAAELLSARGREAWQFHNVGLDDAEGAPPVLKAGMVVAYEIMFAVRGQGFYLEDMVLVEPAGHRMLTPGLPYTAREVERTAAAARPR